MSDDQAPQEGDPVTDPAAPFGRRPDGTPYKRDPGPFAHLRGKPFGSQNGAPPEKRAAPGKAPAKRATLKEAPRLTADGYGKKIATGFKGLARLLSRRAPVPAAIVAVRAPEMAEAWGKVAVSYPSVGRAIDRLTKGGDLSDAIGSTMITLVMIAHVGGLTKGLPFEDMIAGAVSDALDRFQADAEHQAMRDAMEARLVADAEAHNARAAAGTDGNPG